VCTSINAQDDQINFAALQLLKQQKPNIIILISVGGAAHSVNFSQATKSAAVRQSFAQSCVSFMKSSGFDGVDIDWEFPAARDKTNYTEFLRELRRQLDTEGTTDGKRYLLTAALPAGPEKFANFDLGQIHKCLDWINLMAYDFYAASNRLTEFCAPLHPSSTDLEPDQAKRASYNIDAAVRAYLSAGIPAAKIAVGVPFHGCGWGGVSNVNNGLYQQSAGGPASGTWQKDGIFDYKDLSSNYIGSYLRFWNAETSAPWLFDPNTGIMISYDDPQSLGLKADYINTNNLAGAMIWQLSADDNNYSLVNAIAAKFTPPASSTGRRFDLSKYIGILPYDRELFGVYHPLLVSWYSVFATQRLANAQAAAAAAIIAAMARDPALVGAGGMVRDPMRIARLQPPAFLESGVAEQIAHAASDLVALTGAPPSSSEWKQLLAPDVLQKQLETVLARSMREQSTWTQRKA
jgi:GH18 family chitinase